MSRTITIVLIVAVLGSIGYMSYSLFEWYGNRGDVALDQEQELHQERVEELEEQIYEELANQEDNHVSKEKLTEVFDEEVPTVTIAEEVEKPSCEDIKRNMNAFFNHLDKQTYAKSYEIKESSFELFKQITNLLEKGIKENIIQNHRLPFLTAFAFMPIITLIKWNSEGSITMDDDLINQASEIAWNAIKI